MNRSLEDKLREERDKLDTLEPSAGLWDRISQDLDQEEELPQIKRPDRTRLFWQAAAVLLFALSSVLIYDKLQQPEAPERVELLREGLGADFAEIEQHYTKLISLKRAELDKASADFPAIKEEMGKELVSLQSEYQLLGEEFLNTGSQLVIDAMIENLRARIQLLNREIEVLKRTNESYQNEARTI